MNKEAMTKRTNQFGLRAIRLCEALPDTPVARVIRKQILRCVTSVGANYRAACNAKSKADFISKMGTVEEETDESMYWMELIIEAVLLKEELITDLYQEADDLISIVVSSIKTAKRSRE